MVSILYINQSNLIGAYGLEIDRRMHQFTSLEIKSSQKLDQVQVKKIIRIAYDWVSQRNSAYDYDNQIKSARLCKN